MKKSSWCMALTASLVCACSHISMKQTLALYPMPPALDSKLAQQGARSDTDYAAELEKKLAEKISDPERLLMRYLLAKTLSDSSTSKACEIWLEIAQNFEFPIHHVARLRAIETCPASQPGLPNVDELISTTPEPWLQEELFTTALKRSIALNDKSWEMRLSLKQARKERLQSDQIRMLTRALELAKELGDKEHEGKAQLELLTVAPRLNPNPEPGQFMEIAADYRRAREFEKSREYYRKALRLKELNDLDRLKALDGIRQTFKLENDKEKFISATREYANFARLKFFVAGKKSPKFFQPHRHFDAQLTLARAVWTENLPSDATKILEQVEKELGGKHPVDESVYIRARIEEEAGRFNETVRLLDGINSEKVTNRELRSKILWHRAWNLRRVSRTQESIAAMKQLLEIETSPSLIMRNHYWLGRMYQDLGQTSEAQGEFEWLIQNDPLGYYGTLAYRELKRPLPKLHASQDIRAITNSRELLTDLAPSALPTALFEAQESLALEWLIATSELKLGRKLIDQVYAKKRPSPGSPATLEALKAYARTGSYQALFGRVQEFSPEERHVLLNAHPELIFPQPWKEIVHEAAKKYDVPAELIYSIIRQESSFDPMARSHADAFGPMQVIPEVAQKASETTGIKFENPEELYLPEKNIPLGTAFMRGLLNQWQGHFIPVVASYNASEKAVSGWLKTRDTRDAVAFIEDVPYEETRTYLKLVLRNLVFYTRLNSVTPTVAFPEHCLAALQDIKP